MTEQTDLKIVECEITAMPKRLSDPMPQVKVRFEGQDGWLTLFSYFPDELQFSESEFIGLTHAQALKLYSDRDLAYLKS
jgi:hypothetical protein